MVIAQLLEGTVGSAATEELESRSENLQREIEVFNHDRACWTKTVFQFDPESGLRNPGGSGSGRPEVAQL